MSRLTAIRRRLAREDGFTMIITIGVMFVTSLIVVAAFTAANGDIQASHESATDRQAYYAALAGVQQYEYKLQANPNYWQTCEAPKSTVPGEKEERYEVKLLTASTAPTGTTTCSTANPFGTMIESGGTVSNTFRIKSIGYSGPSKREIIATFGVTGFLDYVYYTNFEQGDPKVFGTPTACEGRYYSEWSKLPSKPNCETIEFTSGDEVNGPMHTNDSTDVGGSAIFGREGQVPADVVEINGGTYPSASCSGSAKYFTASKCYTKGPTLTPPPNDESLEFYVEAENTFEGVTYLELKGSSNQISVKYYNSEEKEVKKTISWPKNGLLYVKPITGNGFACTYKFEYNNDDNSNEESKEKGCGTVYVKGTYSSSLTIASTQDVVINGTVNPTSVEGKLGNTPSGTTVLGLIATEYVRVYHPCSSGKNGAGSLENPWIYAAILSTAHSFIVDNFNCGSSLGKLNEFGGIAQNYRGTVGTNKGATGYIKNYEYDNRLATEEPPYFLAPLKTGWKIVRETAPKPG